ncbi:MAG: hypothetical protein AAB116_25550 [Candidatus Poribacteria bacterium]
MFDASFFGSHSSAMLSLVTNQRLVVVRRLTITSVIPRDVIVGCHAVQPTSMSDGVYGSCGENGYDAKLDYSFEYSFLHVFITSRYKN